MLSQPSFDRGYADLQKKIVRRLKAAKIQHQIFETLEKTFTTVLAEDGIVVSRAERKRLLTLAAQSILEDMLKKLAASAAAPKS